jgi:molybdate transport system substrate-binding protein
MKARPMARHVFAAAAGATVLAACGSGTATSSGTASASPTPHLTGSLTVFAAASLTNAFNAAEVKLEAGNPGFKATYSFAGSQQLVQNVINGAPADVIATADMATMQRLVGLGLVDTPRVFAHNVLEIAVAPGNPKGISTLADLARPGISVVLADPTVPAGKYAQQALAKAGVTVTPKSLGLSVATVLQSVASGDADAAIVYVTDVSGAGGRVTGVAIPDADNVVAAYPIAVVKTTLNRTAAQVFVTEVVSGTIHAELLSRGFRPT